MKMVSQSRQIHRDKKMGCLPGARDEPRVEDWLRGTEGESRVLKPDCVLITQDT